MSQFNIDVALKFFEEGETSTKTLLNNLKEIQNIQSQINGTGEKLKVTSDSKEVVQLVAQIKQLSAELEKTKALQSKTSQQLDLQFQKEKILTAERVKAVKQQAKEELGLVDTYDKTAQRLNKLIKVQRNLELQGKTNVKGYEGLVNEINKLDTSLKNVDATGGRFQRNVGNYPQQLKALQKELQGLEVGSEAFNKVAVKAGELKDKIQDAKDATKAFATESKATTAKNLFGQIFNDVKDLDFKGASEKASQFASVVRSISFGEAIGGIKSFGTALLDIGKALLLNPFTILITAVVGLGIALKGLYDSFSVGNKAFEDAIKGLEGVTNATNDLRKANRDLDVDLKVASGQISKVNGEKLSKQNKFKDEYIKLLNEQRIAEKKLRDDIAKEVDEDGFKGTKSLLTSLGYETNATKKQKEGLSEIQKAYNANLKELQIKFGKELTIQQLEEAKQQAELQDKNNKEAKEKAKKHAEELEKDRKEAEQKRLDDFKRTYELEKQISDQQDQQQLDSIADKSEKEIFANQIARDNEKRSALEQNAERLRQIDIKDKDYAEKKAESEELLRLQLLNINTKYDDLDATRRYNKNEADVKATQEGIQKQLSSFQDGQRIALITKENELIEQGKTEKEIQDELHKQEIDNLKALIEEKQALGIDAREEELKLAKIEKADRQKEFEQQKEFLKQIENQVFDSLKKRSDANIEALNKQISEQQKNIDTQRALAEKGLDNTLAFEQRRAEELEAQKIREQKKAQRLAKIQTFFNLVESYSKTNPNTAIPKALAITTLGDVIAGQFEQGGVVEDRIGKGGKIENGIFKGRSHKRGGIIIEAEGEEGILSKKEMRNLGKDNFYAFKDALKQPLIDNPFNRSNEQINLIKVDTGNNAILSRLESLENTIKNKRETSLNIDNLGNIIRTEVERGVTKHTIKKFKV